MIAILIFKLLLVTDIALIDESRLQDLASVDNRADGKTLTEYCNTIGYVVPFEVSRDLLCLVPHKELDV